MFVNEKRNQTEAKQDCENQFAKNTKGRLLEPRDTNTNKLVYEESKNVFGEDDYIWVGIDDISAENQWTYSSSGQNVSKTFWTNEQPDGGTNQGCVIFFKAKEGLWNDVECSSNFRYICEFEDRTAVPIQEKLLS